MDGLLAEVAAKRKAIESDPVPRQTKYMRRGEIERLREEQEKKAKEEKEAEKLKEKEAAESAKKLKVCSHCNIIDYTRCY